MCDADFGFSASSFISCIGNANIPTRNNTIGKQNNTTRVRAQVRAAKYTM